ncbi:MAG: hypothetical protein ACYDH1_13205 [Anaerolineaceae bacterium]|jgi:hypothetical protein
MVNQPNQYDDDDGRVICDMDVEGMRWHDKRVRREETVKRKTVSSEQLTRSESSRFTWNAILASMLLVLVFSITWVLFILFCTKIWFR